MNYYYDVLLNFLDENVGFYEWDSLDNLEYYKRIPLVGVDSKTLNDFINNDVKVEKEFLELIENKAKKKGECPSYVAIFADRNGSIALEFDKDGNSISRSFLEVGDDLNIVEVLYTVDIIKLDYEVIKKVDYNRSLRDENKIKLIIRTELETLEKNKEYTKLKYLYMEWFNKEPSDGENMYKVMNEKLSDEIGIKEKRIYDLIKLSYNKV